ncbi:hypothetical protein MPSEU_000702000 [Mayamaea pseudoterrestris]|nr:hypothetical protein MPSEU_000702000 [Mayamaea pseudoterrestris]
MLRHSLLEAAFCCCFAYNAVAFTGPSYRRQVYGQPSSNLDFISSYERHHQRLSPLFKQKKHLHSNSRSNVQEKTIEREVEKGVLDEENAPSLNGQAKLPSEEEESSSVDAVSVEAPAKNSTENAIQLDPAISTSTDAKYMRMAIQMAESVGGERAAPSAFPNPTVGAVLVSADGIVIGRGRSDYKAEAVRNCIQNAGLKVTPLSEWCMAWPSDPSLRHAISNATLYVTLEPSAKRHGTARPSTTNLIRETGIPRVVIGCSHPVRELATKGAKALHAAGISVTMIGSDLQNECQELIREYSNLQNNKLMSQARKHVEIFRRPLGFLHCSVVDSDNVEAFARHGNAFGTDFEGKNLGFRDFGSYEIAPPPEMIWVDTEENDDSSGFESMMDVNFEEEYTDNLQGSPMMPWYEQCDAIVGTFPRKGYGRKEDDNLAVRLNGLKWMATHGEVLPAGVERILVMDATDLKDLPIVNGNHNLPSFVDVEAFWKAADRKPTRVLLRRGINAQARAAAKSAAKAAEAAADAAKQAASALESGDATKAAEAAIACQNSAQASMQLILHELQEIQEIKSQLEGYGVIVEMIEGAEPIDVMKHIGERNGYKTVVWRAGCWGTHGSTSVLEGAFQWISAHLAVDATGGKFWQLMLAENAIQGACGQPSKVKIFAEQENLSLEYCDQPDADSDCALLMDGRPVRHIRVDCRVALFDNDRPREFNRAKTTKMSSVLVEQAPWFL